MPKVLHFGIDGSQYNRLIVEFERTTQEWRQRFKAWILNRFPELIQEVFWRYASDVLVIIVKCGELAFAQTALKEEIPRRALFR